MLVHVCKTRALLLENIYFKRIAFFFFLIKNRGHSPWKGHSLQKFSFGLHGMFIYYFLI